MWRVKASEWLFLVYLSATWFTYVGRSLLSLCGYDHPEPHSLNYPSVNRTNLAFTIERFRVNERVVSVFELFPQLRERTIKGCQPGLHHCLKKVFALVVRSSHRCTRGLDSSAAPQVKNSKEAMILQAKTRHDWPSTNIGIRFVLFYVKACLQLLKSRKASVLIEGFVSYD